VAKEFICISTSIVKVPMFSTSIVKVPIFFGRISWPHDDHPNSAEIPGEDLAEFSLPLEFQRPR
jgi:hypothetical protein